MTGKQQPIIANKETDVPIHELAHERYDPFFWIRFIRSKNVQQMSLEQIGLYVLMLFALPAETHVLVLEDAVEQKLGVGKKKFRALFKEPLTNCFRIDDDGIVFNATKRAIDELGASYYESTSEMYEKLSAQAEKMRFAKNPQEALPDVPCSRDQVPCSRTRRHRSRGRAKLLNLDGLIKKWEQKGVPITGIFLSSDTTTLKYKNRSISKRSINGETDQVWWDDETSAMLCTKAFWERTLKEFDMTVDELRSHWRGLQTTMKFNALKRGSTKNWEQYVVRNLRRAQNRQLAKEERAAQAAKDKGEFKPAYHREREVEVDQCRICKEYSGQHQSWCTDELRSKKNG